MSIKAIPTWYNGIEFDSRLEVKNAVFFDCMDVEYIPKHQGYLLDRDRIPYLADFYLPHLRCWIEIKGEKPTEEEMMKCEKLAIGTGKPTYCFWGPPRPWPRPWVTDGRDDGPAYAWLPEWGFFMDYGYNFIQCYDCGEIRIECINSGDMYCHKCGGIASDVAPQLEMARETARTHRFADYKNKKNVGTPVPIGKLARFFHQCRRPRIPPRNILI